MQTFINHNELPYVPVNCADCGRQIKPKEVFFQVVFGKVENGIPLFSVLVLCEQCKIENRSLAPTDN